MNKLLAVADKRLKRLFTVSRKQGLPPGTMVYTGQQQAEPMRISIFDYDADNLSEQDNVAPEACAAFKGTGTVTWINVTGLHDTETISRIEAASAKGS